ncbi:MAG TPA: transglycosylase SLT domain-containing protein [Terriglobia bacterium]|nr:transglycosylase SLT domain-containing protein [Terriglobia bacterium]
MRAPNVSLTINKASRRHRVPDRAYARRRACLVALQICLALATCAFVPARATLSGKGVASQRAVESGSSVPTLIPAALKALAAHADRKPGWAPLARYAASARDRETKGLAYLALGYREYQAQDYVPAMDHLAQAAATGFVLGDYAVYYRASAASLADEPEIAARALGDFATRFPQSTLALDATRLLAWSLIGAHRPVDAVNVLGTVADIPKHPPLELLLGQAREGSADLRGAVQAYQELYYGSPNAPEAGPAGTALKRLEGQLGTSYSAPSEDLRATRARALENGGRHAAALSEYEALLKDDPTSASAVAWRLGRDRCWSHLGRTSEAAADLAAPGWPSGELDAERGLVMLRVAEGNRDETAALAELDRLARLYPQSPSYAAALNSVAFFFTRQEEWGRSAVYNAKLASAFPDSDLAPRALWESAWAAYVGGEREGAEKDFLAYLGRYPTSFRAPAALYWVGRLEELEGRPAQARAIYTLLSATFRSDYYAAQAAKRLSESSTPGAPGAPAAAGTISTSVAATVLTPEVETIRSKAAPPPDPALVCPRLPGTEERPGLTLAALGLVDLAEHDLRTRLQAESSGPESARLRLALASVQRDGEKYDLATYNAKRAVPGYTEYDFSALPAGIWTLLYPEVFWDLVQRNAAAYHLDPYLVMALIRQESGFNAKAVSGPGARGLMQLLPPTARAAVPGGRRNLSHRRAAGNLMDPRYNLRAGCSYLAQILGDFNGNVEQALAAYNAGPDRVREWLNGHSYAEDAAFVESIPFPETRAYVETVLRDAAVYRRLMTGSPRFRPCGSHS